MSREYTMRGTLKATEATRALVVDDGRYTHGFVIEEFRVWPAGPTLPTGFNSNGVLSFLEVPPPTMNCEETGTISWAAWIEDTTNGVSQFWILDPDHVVNQDLFVHNLGGTAMNYLVKMRPLVMTPDQGVLQLVKSQNQS